MLKTELPLRLKPIPLILLALLAGCNQDRSQVGSTRDPDTGVYWRETKMLTQPDGCVLYKLDLQDMVRDIYTLKCPTQNTSTNYRCGKSNCYSNVAAEETPQQKLRQAMLSKLTPEERKLLPPNFDGPDQKQ